MSRVIFFLFFMSSAIALSQVVESDSLVDYIKIKGDSIVEVQ